MKTRPCSRADPGLGNPLYTDVRLYGEAGILAATGAGPRTVLYPNAKRADEHVELEDLRRATKVVARTLCDLLNADRKTAAAERRVAEELI